MKMKKLLALALALSLTLSFFGTFEIAASAEEDVTFALEDEVSWGSSPAPNIVYFPVSLSGSFTLEFDYKVNRIADAWMYFSKDGALWSAGQIGIGINKGEFTPMSGSGGVSAKIADVKAGETYHVKISADVEANSYDLTLTLPSGDTVSAGKRYFRTNVDYINSVALLTNSPDAYGDIEMLNAKFYVPSDVSGIEKYTLSYEGVEAPGRTVYTSGSIDLGYDGEKVFPNIKIDTFDGYVFKEKKVDTSAQTITLVYEKASDLYFFDNVDHDTPLVSLNMLGAHDAFTAEIDGKKYDAGGIAANDGGSKNATLTLAGSTSVQNMSKAQSLRAYDLLESGVRYFDVRLTKSTTSQSAGSSFLYKTAPHTNGIFYTTHGVLGEEFRSVAFTISQWAKEHPGEVIILDFQSVFDNGGASEDTWRSVWKILQESGIADYTSINTSAANGTLAGRTIGELTNNGERAGIITFGQQTGQYVGNFLVRKAGDVFSGLLYSAYQESDGLSRNIGTSFSADYINAQITLLESSDTAQITRMIRVMQGQSESGNLLNQAGADNTSLFAALKENKYWLSSLPVVMVNDVGNNTDEIVDLLKECNTPQDVVIKCTTTSGESFTVNKKAMIGTIFPYGAKYSYINAGDKRYYVSEDNVIPTPYGAAEFKVEEITSNVFTLTNDGRVGSFAVNPPEQDTNCLSTGDATDTGLNSFLAFNWGGAGTYNRIGAAILDMPKGSTFTLKAERYRNEGNNPNPVTTLTIWALSLEEFKTMDSVKEIYASLGRENTVAATSSIDESKKITNEIALDAEKLKAASGESGKVVILGTATVGLFGLSGDMHIEGGYKVTIDGKTQTYPAGENSIVAEGIAYTDEAGNIYTPEDGKLSLTVSSDITLTKLTLGVKMATGAQVRLGQSHADNIADDSGLRFIGTVEKENTLAAIAQEAEDKEKNGIFVKITADGSSKSLLIPITAYQDGEGESVFTAVLTNLSADNYNRLFTATPVVVVNGVTYEGTESVSRSIFEVASALLVSGEESDSSVPGVTYEIDDAVKAVLNAYVNSVGVRFGWDKQTGSLKGSPEDYYQYGWQDKKTVFFEVSVENESDGAYIITIKPVGSAVIDEKTLEKSLRINNNNKTAIKYVENIKKNEDGSVTFKFTPPTE